ncbi:hypothetical protein CXB51_015460 [Gossypium anomalum]|uniref:J domain-containing protein n=1 Tax=Gossypium anomalum TaxID=47600 RepID=A0A8J6CWQ3_9ROSI|nr:hypothetical protein CXB51_015460 [Gossypium anomalum]
MKTSFGCIILALYICCDHINASCTDRNYLQIVKLAKAIPQIMPLYVSSNCLPVKALKYEPAGHAFHNAALKLFGCEEDDNTEVDDQKVGNDKEQVYMPSSDSYSSQGKKKSGADGKQQDHYALLGSHLRYIATEDQIRKSYREAALRHHSDKLANLLLVEETEAAKQAKKDEIENYFKSIQEAYEILIDPIKRRIYDSTDEFDDEIPTECAPQDFFKVFSPAFMRNGRWSVTQPIPSLGDDSTSLKNVDNFYNFWYSFKSWREFPHADEYDLEQAESRDHKRWMERQNAKLSEKARKDPRILRRKEEEKAEKQRKKEAKVRAKQLQEEEAARAAEEERRQKEEEEKRAAEAALQHKKNKEKEKKLLRKERTRLRALSAPVLSQHLLDLSEEDVESLCMTLGFEQLRSLCDKMDNKEALDILSSSSSEKNEKPWTKEEIELLRKGTQKYPKGTSSRWEVISEYIGMGRSVEEILKATRIVLLQKPDATKAFDSFLEKRKPAAAIASPLSTREEVEGVSMPSRTENITANTSSPEDSGKAASNPVDVVSGNGVSSSSKQDVWSAVQERALIQALKTFPKETSQRWERVGTAVPRKTVNQCKKKFALVKENFRSKKSTA